MSATANAAADRAKMAKLLGMLGSDHAGERDAAGLAAHRLLLRSGMTWDQVVSPQPATPRPAPWQTPRRQYTWREKAAACLERRWALGPWEEGFLADIRRFPRLTPKQSRKLNEIAGRVLPGGAL